MAVDIKQLRIGSHIEVMGEMCEIDSIGGGLQIGCINTTTWVGVDAGEDWVRPIKITPELLVELGFVYHKYDNCKLWEMEFKDGFHSHLNLEYDDERNCFNLNCWDCKELVVDIHCEFLHELENWVYLVYGKELIEE